MTNPQEQYEINSIISQVTGCDFRRYNVKIARLLSINSAVFLADLLDRYSYHFKNNELVNSPKHGDGWFYYTADKCEERTALTTREQFSASKMLVEKGLIEQKLIGCPAMRHYRINYQQVKILLDDFSGKSSFDKTQNCNRQNAKLNTGTHTLLMRSKEEEEDEIDINKKFENNEPFRKRSLPSQVSFNQTSEEEENPPPNSDRPPREELAEKMNLLKDIPLTETEMMKMCRRNLEEVRIASIAYHRDQVKVDNPYKMMMAVIDGNWKTHAKVQGEQKKKITDNIEATKRSSLLESLRCLNGHYPDRVDGGAVGTLIKIMIKDFDQEWFEAFSLDIYLDKLDDDYCRKLVGQINNRLHEKKQIVYNELFGNKIFEVLE